MAERIQRQKDAMVRIFKIIGFSPDATTALVEDQLLFNKETLLELDDDQVENLCKTVSKSGGNEGGHFISEIAVTRLQLLVFYVKHLDRTDRLRFMNLDNVDLDTIVFFTEQKKLEGAWFKTNPENKHEAIQLDNQRAAEAFDLAVMTLRNIRGVSGVPLSYVVRQQLVPKHSIDDPACGTLKSLYTTLDEELEARAPIVKWDFYGTRSEENAEKFGPFHPAYLADTMKAWSVLHALWSNSNAWKHVKIFDKSKNGRVVYRALHKFFFGDNNNFANISNNKRPCLGDRSTSEDDSSDDNKSLFSNHDDE